MSATIGSLFSGIGGLERGLERAGLGPVIWQAECDDYCRSVLRKHWPDVHCYRDVREVREDAERPVIICGGFPCQDISNAGNRAGIEGERSGLWFEYARVIRVLRPRAVVIENVTALRVRGLCTVLRDLAACGYDAEWDCIPAAAVGAPHIRDRVFVVAWTAQSGVSDAERVELREQRQRCGEQRDEPRAPEPGHDGTDRDVADADGIFRDWPKRSAEWEVEPDVGRVADGVPDRVDRLRALGNAVVPAVAEHVGHIVRGLL